MSDPGQIVYVVEDDDLTRHGAFNYLLEPFGNAELLTNLRRALAYDRLNRRTVSQYGRIRERIVSLTSRERDVLELLARGCANKTMAYEMRVSGSAVELHRARVMEKMGAGPIAQLVRMLMDFEQRTAHGH